MKDATHIEVDAGVRYWEDAAVNGIEDTDGTLIPGAAGDRWKVRIELASGAIEGWPEGTSADIHYKVCDDGLYWLTDAAGQRLAKLKGDYVPSAFLCHGGDGWGDYIIMRVGGDGRIDGYERPEVRADDWVSLEGSRAASGAREASKAAERSEADTGDQNHKAGPQ